MKFTVYGTVAQEEHRSIEIEAEDLEEAKKKAKEWREGAYYYEEKEALGEVTTDTLEIHGEDTFEGGEKVLWKEDV